MFIFAFPPFIGAAVSATMGRVLIGLLAAATVVVCLLVDAAIADSTAGLIPARADFEDDPFAGLESSAGPPAKGKTVSNAAAGFFADNFTLKKEIYSQFSYGSSEEHADSIDEVQRWYSRQSAGIEVLKKFSTANSTVASFDFQGRLVRRDQYIPVINDGEGAEREGWFFEYHNLYLDLYNLFNPVLSDAQRGAAAGHFNLRLGRFYLPFGLNLQTDTHGTLLQLSNERNFGFERDWYAGFWGSVNPVLNYDLYYLFGSGYEPSLEGQGGLVGSRVSLSNKYSNEYGIEGGISFLAGQRLSEHALERSLGVASEAANGKFIQTIREGLDGRYTHLFVDGSLSGAAELSTGEDESEHVLTQLYQIDYLHKSRKWGLSSQFRRFHQSFTFDEPVRRNDADSSIIGEITWFFRNDIGNSNLHWIKLNVEQQLERIAGPTGTVTSIQYYRYW